MIAARTCHVCGNSQSLPSEQPPATRWAYRWVGADPQPFVGLCSDECVTKFQARVRPDVDVSEIDSAFSLLSANSIMMGDSEAHLRAFLCEFASLLVQRALTGHVDALQSLASNIGRLVAQICDRQRFRDALTADEPVSALQSVAGTFGEQELNSFAAAVANEVARYRDPFGHAAAVVDDDSSRELKSDVHERNADPCGRDTGRDE